MVRTKVLKLVLDGYGSYLGMEKGCFVIRDKSGKIERIPLFENEIGEVVVSSGNFISTSVLASCGFWFKHNNKVRRRGNFDCSNSVCKLRLLHCFSERHRRWEKLHAI